jgi:hypothetical protein
VPPLGVKFWTTIDTVAVSGIKFGAGVFVAEGSEHMASMWDVDTGAVFKHPVRCAGCDQEFYFTLRRIAEAKKLACPLCGSDINLADKAYGFVVTKVKQTLALIDQSSPHLQRTSNASGLTGA